MKFKPSYLLLSLALSSSVVFADQVTFDKPELYGDILGQVRWEDGQDYQSEIQRVNIGLKGLHKTEHVNVFYRLEGEYSEDLTARDVEDQDFDTRLGEAHMILINRDLGSIFFGNGTTGTYTNLYSKVDLFQSNNMDRGSNADLFRQGRYGTNQLAYATPIWNNLQMKAALISPDNGNDQDIDVFGLRLLYNTKNFSLVLNRAQVDEKQMPGVQTDDYVRWALASSYKMNNFFIGALAEMNLDDPQGESMVYGLSGKYTLDNVTFKLGAQHKDFDESNKDDQTLFLANATYAFSNQLSTYIEIAEYTEDEATNDPANNNGENRNDNVNIGLNFKF